jgi:hypothetical protein
MEPEVQEQSDNQSAGRLLATTTSPIEASEPGSHRPGQSSGCPERSNNEVKA